MCRPRAEPRIDPRARSLDPAVAREILVPAADLVGRRGFASAVSVAPVPEFSSALVGDEAGTEAGASAAVPVVGVAAAGAAAPVVVVAGGDARPTVRLRLPTRQRLRREIPALGSPLPLPSCFPFALVEGRRFPRFP